MHNKHWPDNREKNGSTADQVNQKEDLLPQVVFTRAFLCGLNDDVGNISENLEDNSCITKTNSKTNNPKNVFLSLTPTCRGMTIMKIFFSLSDKMYLTKAQPVPISASVMKRRAPLSLASRELENVKDKNVKRICRVFLMEKYLQVCDIIHDSPAFNCMPLSVNEVVVDLKETDVSKKDMMMIQVICVGISQSKTKRPACRLPCLVDRTRDGLHTGQV